MHPNFDLGLDVIRRSEHPDPVDGRRLRRALDTGAYVRVCAGAFAPADQWTALSPLERHRTRVLEVVRGLQPSVISHFAAAALWGIDVLGTWPTSVDVTIARAAGGRSTGAVRRHATGLADVERMPFGRHAITTARQTALDLARWLPFVRGVSAMDQAIGVRLGRDALTTTAEIYELLARSAGHRGEARARRVLAFVHPLADNVRESQTRVVLAQLGFPPPRIQERRVLPSGRVVFGDFYFPEHDHWGELDGRGKYRSPASLGVRSAAEAVIDEKNRENEIRRTVRGFSRWEPVDVDHPRRLYDILTRGGLPSRLPRP